MGIHPDIPKRIKNQWAWARPGPGSGAALSYHTGPTTTNFTKPLSNHLIQLGIAGIYIIVSLALLFSIRKTLEPIMLKNN